MAGIIINLLSAYLKSPLDKGVENTFSWWRKSSEVRQVAWQARIERIMQNEEARKDEIASEFRFRLQSIHFLLIAILLLAFFSFAIIMGDTAPSFLRIIILGSSAALLFLSFLALLSAVITASALRRGCPVRS